MKIISTNIAQPKTIVLNGKKTTTGIYKVPTSNPIYLEKEQVRGDEISNRKVHGGEYKACYLFSTDHYPYWQKRYPNLEWNWGMLGENLTVKGLYETKMQVGDIYKVGTALIQVTQPREPCNTFATKMGSKDILKQFIDHARPGTYAKVLEEGFVKVNDEMQLVEKAKNSLSTAQLFQLLFDKDKDKSLLELAINNEALPVKKREKLKQYLNSD